MDEFDCIVNKEVHVNTFPQCCRILYGKNCNSKIVRGLKEPLETSFSSLFGELDKEQMELVKYNSKPVVLLENASAILGIIKDKEGFLERVIKETGSNFILVGSYSIPLVSKSEYTSRYPRQHVIEPYGTGPYSSKYDRKIQTIKQAIKELKIKKTSNAVLHIGAVLREGGHYGIIIKKGDLLFVFDSMQSGAVGPYSSFFVQVAEESFGIKAGVYPIRDKTSLQYTGGFVRPIRGETDEMRMIRLQNMDSQNHFCYMWSIWFFHLYALGGDELVKKTITDLVEMEGSPHPLIRIKRYIWGVLNVLYPTKEDLDQLITEAVQEHNEILLMSEEASFLRVFFLYHFRFIWEDCDSGVFNLFSVIPCDTGICKTMEDALKFSIQDIVYVIED